MSEKASAMSTVAAIETIAGPYRGNRKGWLASVSKAVNGVSYRTVRAFWYREIEDEDHLAAQAIRRTAAELKAKREAKDLASQFETIAGGLNARDPDFHSADIAALVHAARILRGLDSA